MSWNNQSVTGWLKHIYDKLGAIYDKLVSGITTTPGSGTQNVNVAQVNGATPTGTGAMQVQGTAATGAAMLGNPVLMGGNNGSGGVAVPLVVSTRLWIQEGEQTAAADGISNTIVYSLDQSGTARPYGTSNFIHNGTTWDRQRGNTAETVLASAARTIATNSADMTNYNARGLQLVIDVTAFTAGSITVTVQGKDPVSGKYYTLLVSAALAAVATTVLRVYPGATVAANLAANDILPRVWRVSVAVGSADSITYSIGANLVL